MQPLSIDNPRPHQRCYAITTTAITDTTTYQRHYYHRIVVPARSQVASSDDGDDCLLTFLSINSSNLPSPVLSDSFQQFISESREIRLELAESQLYEIMSHSTLYNLLRSSDFSSRERNKFLLLFLFFRFLSAPLFDSLVIYPQRFLLLYVCSNIYTCNFHRFV